MNRDDKLDFAENLTPDLMKTLQNATLTIIKPDAVKKTRDRRHH